MSCMYVCMCEQGKKKGFLHWARIYHFEQPEVVLISSILFFKGEGARFEVDRREQNRFSNPHQNSQVIFSDFHLEIFFFKKIGSYSRVIGSIYTRSIIMTDQKQKEKQREQGRKRREVIWGWEGYWWVVDSVVRALSSPKNLSFPVGDPCASEYNKTHGKPGVDQTGLLCHKTHNKLDGGRAGWKL